VKQQQALEAQRATGEKRMALEREQKEVAARQAGLQAAAQVQGKAEAAVQRLEAQGVRQALFSICVNLRNLWMNFFIRR
jgi:hypothetical protein